MFLRTHVRYKYTTYGALRPTLSSSAAVVVANSRSPTDQVAVLYHAGSRRDGQTPAEIDEREGKLVVLMPAAKEQLHHIPKNFTAKTVNGELDGHWQNSAETKHPMVMEPPLELVWEDFGEVVADVVDPGTIRPSGSATCRHTTSLAASSTWPAACLRSHAARNGHGLVGGAGVVVPREGTGLARSGAVFLLAVLESVSPCGAVVASAFAVVCSVVGAMRSKAVSGGRREDGGVADVAAHGLRHGVRRRLQELRATCRRCCDGCRRGGRGVEEHQA
ncbi:hypothetical protein AK812_SmicGene34801 [Symbiodinium microadriaticum]|uniref:Uncharacterized protein n=1 Tax=Symbiodinium microadriaticum TaxID=2951 RepID=A0A1Q9CN20_SYMMI|nr:hypothetical protein AK812_SmicGene34801 [Symbiodinium microadriaticum]